MSTLGRRRYVADASVVLKWFSEAGEGDTGGALRIRDDYCKGDIELYSPELLIYEIANVLRYKETIKEELISRAITSIYDMDILMPVNSRIMANAVKLARKHGITVYDSSYLSFAREAGCLIVTADKKLCKKIEGIPGIIFISDYE
jgi:predicted nucleic acid-binding protein